MENMILSAKEEIFKLEKILREVNAYLHEAPKGCLKWQRKDKKIYYYKQDRITGEKSKESRWGRKYIKKEEFAMAEGLAKKHYYLLMKDLAEKKIKALKQLINQYPDKQIETVYKELNPERKSLISPLLTEVQEKVKQFEEEVYEQTVMYAGNLKFETERGELVRSKSEVIIANILHRNKEDILYKYERPLHLKIRGMIKTIYPDFTVINIHTGRIVYWEHAGRMDDLEYTEEFVRKMNTYVANGLLPGRDIILTFETQENPLDIGAVKNIVKNLGGGIFDPIGSRIFVP